MAIEGNAYDIHSLKSQPEQVKEPIGGRNRTMIINKGCQAKEGIRGAVIVMLKNFKLERNYMGTRREGHCLSRASILDLISHFKHDNRMLQNCLSSSAGDQINTLLVR